MLITVKQQPKPKDMKIFNPKTNQRRTIRLEGYDYSQAGLYFITLICQDRKHLFGKVINGKMTLSPKGQIAHDEWLNSITIRDNIALHDFIIMPDHIHVILEIIYSKSTEKREGLQSPTQTTGAIIRGYKGAVTKAINLKNESIIDGGTHTRPGMGKGESHSPDTAQTAQNVQTAQTVRLSQTDQTAQISNTTQNNQSTQVTGECNSPRPISIWQRNYYEHIIKNEISYQRISQYIINNPKKWTEKYG